MYFKILCALCVGSLAVSAIFHTAEPNTITIIASGVFVISLVVMAVSFAVAWLEKYKDYM